jgi:hypothetical protein
VHALTLHPRCAVGSVHQIEASVVATPTGCRAEFVARGDIAAITVPIIEPDRGRYDDLWRTTCFEIFWQPLGGSSYREFNLSPSTRWACYDFDDFRQGMRNAPAEVEIDVTVSTDELRVVAHIRSALPTPANVALNAIIEDADGVNRYWALAFADGDPEFHSALCRALVV